MTSPKTCIVIPARLASTRLPEKLLLSETGKPLIQYAYESACRAQLADAVFVACDHPRIRDAVQQFGGHAVMTDPNAACGTDRVAEVAQKLSGAELIVNVQGDEPELSPGSIDLLIEKMRQNPDTPMGTLATPVRTAKDLNDPACVKVVFDRNGRAMYFSRSPIPYPRNWSEELLTQTPALFYQHIGIYAYRRDFLLKIGTLPRSNQEKTESLEQLRVLNEGYAILVGVVQEHSLGIDTPEDYRRFVERQKKRDSFNI